MLLFIRSVFTSSLFVASRYSVFSLLCCANLNQINLHRKRLSYCSSNTFAAALPRFNIFRSICAPFCSVLFHCSVWSHPASNGGGAASKHHHHHQVKSPASSISRAFLVLRHFERCYRTSSLVRQFPYYWFRLRVCHVAKHTHTCTRWKVVPR